MLNLVDSFKIIGKLPLAKYLVIKSGKELSKLDFPYFMKASISEHKTEQKAVLKCENKKEAEKNFKNLRKKFQKEDILIQEEVSGIEMIIGLKQDKVFGKLLMIGFGGIFTEAVKDISFRACPVDSDEIEKMLKELKFFPVLVSRKKYAINKLVKLAEKVSELDVKELDLNPVIVNEDDAIVVDARLEV